MDEELRKILESSTFLRLRQRQGLGNWDLTQRIRYDALDKSYLEDGTWIDRLAEWMTKQKAG